VKAHSSDAIGTFGEAMKRAAPGSQKLALSLRKLIFEIYPSVVEVPWVKQQIIGYGVGPSKKTEHFCYIAPYGSHVNLGFNFGLGLPDPDGLLEGTGKKFRHVKVRKPDDVRNPALRALLRAAVRERADALGRGPG
jgi:hypothetical protein